MSCYGKATFLMIMVNLDMNLNEDECIKSMKEQL
jgi:hypothetical protein